MATTDLTIRLRAQDQASPAMQSVGGATKTLSSLVTALSTGFLAAQAAAQMIVSRLRDLVGAAQEDAREIQVLVGTVEAAGGSWARYGAAIEGAVESMRRQTIFSDSELRRSFNEIIRLSGDVSRAQEGVTLAADIATRTGKDLVAASNLVGDALAGNLRPLTELTPAYKDLIKELSTVEDASLRSEVAIGILHRTFDGAAATVDQSTMGLTKLDQELDELKEAVGRFVLSAAGTEGFPRVTSTVRELAEGIDYLADDSVPRSEDAMTGLIVRLKEVASVMSYGWGLAVKLGEALGDMADGAEEAWRATDTLAAKSVHLHGALRDVEVIGDGIRSTMMDAAQGDVVFTAEEALLTGGLIKGKAAREDAAKATRDLAQETRAMLNEFARTERIERMTAILDEFRTQEERKRREAGMLAQRQAEELMESIERNAKAQQRRIDAAATSARRRYLEYLDSIEREKELMADAKRIAVGFGQSLLLAATSGASFAEGIEASVGRAAAALSGLLITAGLGAQALWSFQGIGMIAAGVALSLLASQFGAAGGGAFAGGRATPAASPRAVSGAGGRREREGPTVIVSIAGVLTDDPQSMRELRRRVQDAMAMG